CIKRLQRLDFCGEGTMGRSQGAMVGSRACCIHLRILNVQRLLATLLQNCVWRVSCMHQPTGSVDGGCNLVNSLLSPRPNPGWAGPQGMPPCFAPEFSCFGVLHAY